MGMRSAEAAQAVGASAIAATVPELVGADMTAQMLALWVLAAMGICTIADIAVPPGASRGKVAIRYAASVVVTLAASYTASAAVHIYWPEWREHIWAVRFGTCIVAGMFLHRFIAAAPTILSDFLDYARSRRGGGGAAGS